MARLAVIDGVSFAPEDAKVSVYDRGFLYGDAVFETVRTYAGKPFALADHLARLERSADSIAMDLPLGSDELAREIERAIVEAGNEESLVRVIVSRGAGPLGLDSERDFQPVRVVLVEPLEVPPASYYRDGVAVACVTTVRASDAVNSAKLNNYLASVLALRKARSAGGYEALVVSPAGYVVEGTTSNVFAVRSGGREGRETLITPPLDAGVLPGITRALVVRLAETLGLRVRLETMTPAELARVDEIFLSSSVRELLPVVRIDDETVGTGTPGPVTRRLHRAFRQTVGVGAEPMPWERA